MNKSRQLIDLIEEGPKSTDTEEWPVVGDDVFVKDKIYRVIKFQGTTVWLLDVESGQEIKMSTTSQDWRRKEDPVMGESGGLDPDSKDIMRLTDIKRKSAGNKEKAKALAGQMSMAIGDFDKATRRAKAALQVYKDDPKFAREIHDIFMISAGEL